MPSPPKGYCPFMKRLSLLYGYWLFIMTTLLRYAYWPFKRPSPLQGPFDLCYPHLFEDIVHFSSPDMRAVLRCVSQNARSVVDKACPLYLAMPSSPIYRCRTEWGALSLRPAVLCLRPSVRSVKIVINFVEAIQTMSSEHTEHEHDALTLSAFAVSWAESLNYLCTRVKRGYGSWNTTFVVTVPASLSAGLFMNTSVSLLPSLSFGTVVGLKVRFRHPDLPHPPTVVLRPDYLLKTNCTNYRTDPNTEMERIKATLVKDFYGMRKPVRNPDYGHYRDEPEYIWEDMDAYFFTEDEYRARVGEAVFAREMKV